MQILWVRRRLFQAIHLSNTTLCISGTRLLQRNSFEMRYVAKKILWSIQVRFLHETVERMGLQAPSPDWPRLWMLLPRVLPPRASKTYGSHEEGICGKGQGHSKYARGARLLCDCQGISSWCLTRRCWKDSSSESANNSSVGFARPKWQTQTSSCCSCGCCLSKEGKWPFQSSRQFRNS